jgi:nuclear pore complex protein Nup107
VPELIIRLHYLLYSSRKHIPGYVHFYSPFFLLNPILISLLFFLSFPFPFLFFPFPLHPTPLQKNHRNLKRAIELANIVADSRYRLYETFSGNGGRSLLDYLQVVRQAVLAGVENGGSDPFRIIAAL